MNNPEIVITLITTILTVVSAVLGIIASKNEKAKKFYKTYVELEKIIKELCIVAEQNYKDGSKKKKHVLANVNTYLKKNNIEFDLRLIEEIIESLIKITKKN